jgi:hypothetical protein
MLSCKGDTLAFRWSLLEIGFFIGMILMASSQPHGRSLCSDLSATSNRVFLMAVFPGGNPKDFRLSLALWWRPQGPNTQRLPWHQRTSEVSILELSFEPRGSVLPRLRTDGK